LQHLRKLQLYKTVHYFRHTLYTKKRTALMYIETRNVRPA